MVREYDVDDSHYETIHTVDSEFFSDFQFLQRFSEEIRRGTASACETTAGQEQLFSFEEEFTQENKTTSVT